MKKSETLPDCETCALPAVNRHGVLCGREGVIRVCEKCLPSVRLELKRFEEVMSGRIGYDPAESLPSFTARANHDANALAAKFWRNQ